MRLADHTFDPTEQRSSQALPFLRMLTHALLPRITFRAGGKRIIAIHSTSSKTRARVTRKARAVRPSCVCKLGEGCASQLRVGPCFCFFKNGESGPTNMCFLRGFEGSGRSPGARGLTPALGAETGPKSPGTGHPPALRGHPEALRGWSSAQARLRLRLPPGYCFIIGEGRRGRHSGCLMRQQLDRCNPPCSRPVPMQQGQCASCQEFLDSWRLV